MKKLLLGFLLMAVTNLALAVTIAEYIKINGPLMVEKGVLDLRNSGITSLDGIEVIEAPRMVTKLYFSNNQITSISASHLDQFPNLIVLDLSKNRLTDFPAISMKNLRELNLEGNKIEALKNLNLPKLKKLRTDGNPLKTVTNLYAPAVKKFKVVKDPKKLVKTVRSISVGDLETIDID